MILGMGNPLLDISDNVDKAMLDKYGLESGGIILAEDKHQPLFAEMSARPGVQYIAGGATQNSIRVAQWMLQTPGATAYMGCVGKDDFAEKMKASCEKDGVKTSYMIDASTPTGSCAVLIDGIERSLCTNLMAANNFKIDHVKEAENLKVVQQSKIIYSAGFFITVSTDSMKLAAAEAAKSGAKYCLNLSAPFLMQVPPFKAFILEILPMVDFLFCNETEAATYAETEGWGTSDVSFIATRLSLIPMAKGGHRTVVITQGCEPTIVAFRGKVTKHAILTLPKEKLVDTNGAGDAYVGGFLAALSKGLPTADCCRAGAYSASVIVQHSGCTFPAAPQYDWSVKQGTEIIRGPTPAPGSGRAAFVSCAGLVWTVCIPAGKTPEDSVAEQTRKALKQLDDRLAKAGTDKRHVLEATVFVKEMSMKDEMDSVWKEWVPEGCHISRACVAADLAPGDLVEMKVTATKPGTDIIRGPTPAPGSGRAAFVSCSGLVWTVCIPAGKTPEDSVAEQTRKALKQLEERLEKAGTDKSHVIEATVFLKDMAMKDEMDSVWRGWVPEGCHISRAAVAADLAPGDLVEMKVTAAKPDLGIIRGPTPAAGSGRAAFVSSLGLVWTVAFPAGKTPEDSVAEQTRKALKEVDGRLAKAGTDKSKVLEATVFVKEMSMKDEMDTVWCEWVPEGCGISRACVSTGLAPGDLVEMKITAAIPS